MWARIENNVVMELTDIDPTGRYHDSLIWVECPPDTQRGYIYNSGEFTPPPEVAASCYRRHSECYATLKILQFHHIIQSFFKVNG